MSAELLLENAHDPRPLLQGIANSAQRGTELVRQILAFARGADGEKTLLDLRQVVNDTTSLFVSTFPRNISIEVDIPEDLPGFRGNATQLHQVILNLCVNARDAMPDGGRIIISASTVTLDERQTSLQKAPLSGYFLQLRVSDTGAGIPPEVLPKILDPFFSTKGPGKGTGLGLATVVGIVRGHGGSLDVTTEVGHGTTFTLYFPAPEPARSIAEPEKPEDTGLGGGEWVLCVDDEPAILSTTSMALTRSGYRVLVARDGAEALAIWQKHREQVALVITDMMMPTMTGAELIVALRKLSPQLHIIAVSGTFSSIKLPEGAENTVQAMLHKPYNIALLLQTVRRVITADRAN